MSIHTIPDRYLNTTLHFFRDSVSFDSIGDLKTSQNLIYNSLKGNVQPQKSTTEFNLNGKVYIQDHVAYVNRFENNSQRNIHNGDFALDQETNIRYLVLGVEEWQSANPNISDSHHLKIILKSISGIPQEQLNVTTVASKAKIT